MSFLQLLRDELRNGLAKLPASFRERHARFLLSQQRPDGGFANRRGQSDLYYTAFAVRSLSALGALTPETAARAGAWLSGLAARPETERVRQPRGAFSDAVMSVSWWDARSLCEETGAAFSAEEKADARRVTLGRLEKLRRADGGWAKTDIDADGSLYHTFLALGVHLRMECDPPETEKAAAFVRTLAQAGGGFFESRHSKRPGTNGTAAGVMASLLLGAGEPLDPHAAFLAGMRGAEGGFLATPAAPIADLLSTYTALFTLKLLDHPVADAAAILRFARELEQPDGGYIGFTLETKPDCEYTFYGLGVEALASGTDEG